MLLKHANRYDLYSVKVFSPIELADIGFDVLKLVILMSVIDDTLGYHKPLLRENPLQARKGLA
uniref:Calponin-homology (CH) domain-containing protein n=1 Tax=Heterorhabditis bacteriophora TaxID=37862 RepID=A0A1I7XBN3_HETBA